MNKIETLATEIMNEFAKDNDPITIEEAREMAEMELKEKANRRYEKANAPRKKAERKKKEDPIKREIISTLAQNLTRVVIDNESDPLEIPSDIIITNPEKEITFTLRGENYSVTLTKHRPKKQGGFLLGSGGARSYASPRPRPAFVKSQDH